MSAALVGTISLTTGAASLSPAWSGDQPRTAGHTLIAVVVTQNGSSVGATCGTPAGWNAVTSNKLASSVNRAGVFVFDKIATGADAAPSFSLNLFANSFCWLLEVSGLSGATVTDIQDIVFTPGGGTTTTFTTTAGTTTSSPDWILAAEGGKSTVSGQTVTWNNGYSALTTGSNSTFTFGALATKAVQLPATETPSVTLGANTLSVIVAVAYKVVGTIRKVNVGGTATTDTARNVNVGGVATAATRKVNINGVPW